MTDLTGVELLEHDPGAIPSLDGSDTPFLSLSAACEAHLRYLEQKHYAATTLTVRRVHLRLFCRWAAARGSDCLEALTPALLMAYQRHLLEYRKRNGQPLTLASQHARLTHLRVFGAYLVRHRVVTRNPAAELELPRLGYRLPAVLSPAEIDQILQQPDVHSDLGLRDRAILETLYSTGLRRTELIRLTLADVDPARRLVTVREGKGRRDRVIPIGARAVGWMMRYVAEVRPPYVCREGTAAVFLTCRGTAFTPNHLSALVRRYMVNAHVGKRGACHLFRHAMATLMLEGGADIRFIQQMLGHADLTSTQLYTHVSIPQLQAVHAATHPAARDELRPHPARGARRTHRLRWPRWGRSGRIGRRSARNSPEVM